MMDSSGGQQRVSEPLSVLDDLGRTTSNLVLVGRGNPDLYELPRGGQMASQLGALFERAWTASTFRTFLSIPIEYVLESLRTMRGCVTCDFPSCNNCSNCNAYGGWSFALRVSSRGYGEFAQNAREHLNVEEHRGVNHIPPKPPSLPREKDHERLDDARGMRRPKEDKPPLTGQEGFQER